jgi:predicted dehydrogenase
MNQVDVVVVGAGLRGQAYAHRAVATGAARIVAVAEPDPARRAAFAERYAVEPGRTFTDWTGLVEAGCLADAAVVATPDRLHTGPAVALVQCLSFGLSLW